MQICQKCDKPVKRDRPKVFDVPHLCDSCQEEARSHAKADWRRKQEAKEKRLAPKKEKW
jgi:RNA polymerase-binding transcription factor DksA